jgi:Uma2 family endonuclease
MKILKAKERSGNRLPQCGYHKSVSPDARKKIVYPDSDGKPMADNTKQFDWIVKIKENLERIYRNDPDVFIAGDLLWYPVEGNNKIRIAPDAMVVFGRPKGHRGSYRSWEENHISPQGVFEILSPGNKRTEMERKFLFYQEYRVEEYCIYDPDRTSKSIRTEVLKGQKQGANRLDDELNEIRGNSRMSNVLNQRIEFMCRHDANIHTGIHIK